MRKGVIYSFQSTKSVLLVSAFTVLIFDYSKRNSYHSLHRTSAYLLPSNDGRPGSLCYVGECTRLVNCLISATSLKTTSQGSRLSLGKVIYLLVSINGVIFDSSTRLM